MTFLERHRRCSMVSEVEVIRHDPDCEYKDEHFPSNRQIPQRVREMIAKQALDAVRPEGGGWARKMAAQLKLEEGDIVHLTKSTDPEGESITVKRAVNPPSDAARVASLERLVDASQEALADGVARGVTMRLRIAELELLVDDAIVMMALWAVARGCQACGAQGRSHPNTFADRVTLVPHAPDCNYVALVARVRSSRAASTPVHATNGEG